MCCYSDSLVGRSFCCCSSAFFLHRIQKHPMYLCAHTFPYAHEPHASAPHLRDRSPPTAAFKWVGLVMRSAGEYPLTLLTFAPSITRTSGSSLFRALYQNAATRVVLSAHSWWDALSKYTVVYSHLSFGNLACMLYLELIVFPTAEARRDAEADGSRVPREGKYKIEKGIQVFP